MFSLSRHLGIRAISSKRLWVSALALAAATVPIGKALADNNSTAILTNDKVRIGLILEGKGIETNGHTALEVIYGFGSDKPKPFGRWEAGFDYVLSAGKFGGANIPTDQGDPNTAANFGKPVSTWQRFFWNFKTQLYENPKTGVRVALGGYLIGSNAAHAANLGFLAISKQTQKYGYFHTGIIHSFSKETSLATPSQFPPNYQPGDPVHTDMTYFQLDYAKVVRPRLVAGFNFYTGKSRASVFFPAVIYFLTPMYDSSITVGDFWFNDKSVRPSQHQLYVQFDYYFDRVPKKGPPPTAMKTPELPPAGPKFFF
jgi:hypothetical protein